MELQILKTFYDYQTEVSIYLCKTDESFDKCYYIHLTKNIFSTNDAERYLYESFEDALNDYCTMINNLIGREKVVEEKPLISQLGLSVRTYNALMRAKIKTIPQLLETPKSRLKRFRNLGEKSISEIEEAVKEHGYELVE